MSKDFRGSDSHRQLFRPYWGPPVWHSHWVKEQGKPTSQKPLTAEKQSIKCQLYTTHVGAVGWELHSRFHHDMRGEGRSQITSKSKQGAHIHHVSVTRETCVQRPFTAEASPLSASSTQHMWELLAGNRTAALP